MSSGTTYHYFFDLFPGDDGRAAMNEIYGIRNWFSVGPYDRFRTHLGMIDNEWIDRIQHTPNLANANRFQGIVGFWNAYTLLLNIAESDQDSTTDSAALLRRLWASYTAYEIQIPFHEWCELPEWIVRTWNRFEITAYKLAQLCDLQEMDLPGRLKVMSLNGCRYRYEATVPELEPEITDIDESPFVMGVG